jgi:hypothetical protein
MSDKIPIVSWSVGAKDGSPSGRFLQFACGKKSHKAVIAETIEQEGWSEQVTRIFPACSSLWHSFWMDSPLSLEQITFLLRLFALIADKKDCTATSLTEFIRGLREADERRQVVYVDLSPPGHVDMGWTTVFPHCPRCKAEAPLPRWQHSYSTEPIICPVCRTHYRPAETYSCERYYYTDAVVCSTCYQKYPIRSFSEEERNLLEKHHYYEEFLDELGMLKRVGDFYRRHPGIEDKLRSLFFINGIPLHKSYMDELVQLSVSAEARHGDPMAREDAEVIDYLKHHFTRDVNTRMKFAAESSDRLKPIVQARCVKCPHCGGKVA